VRLVTLILQEQKERTVLETLTKHASRYAILIITVFYVTGMLLVNVFYSNLGFTDFSVMRPRYVFVGFDYYLYLILPLVVILVPYYALKIKLNLLSLAYKAPTFLLSVLIMICISSSALSYFIPYTGVIYGDPKNITKLGAAIKVTISFWRLYYHSYAYVYLGLFFLPSLVLFWMHRAQINKDIIKRGAVTSTVIISFGIIAMIIPYVTNIFPNISYAVGGGQPQVVNLMLNDKAENKIKPHLDIKDTKQHSNVVLLWHYNDSYYYVSKAIKTDYAPTYAISKDNIIGIRNLYTAIRFEDLRTADIAYFHPECGQFHSIRFDFSEINKK
jgi:hypothetical protein